MSRQVGLTMVIMLCLILFQRFIKKDSLIGVAQRSLPVRESGLVSAVILGDKTGLEKGFYEKLKISGLVHLVVVSGSNVTLIAVAMVEGLAAWCGRKKSIIIGLLTVVIYGSMVGWEAPILRAIIFLAIYYWAQLLGRKFNIWRALTAAALIMITADINMVTSVSFWLSLVAFGAVVTARDLKVGRKNWWWRSFCNSVWVSVWLTPILAISFGKVSVIGPILNIVAVIGVEIITIIGGIGMVVGLIMPILGKILMWSIYPILLGLVNMVEVVGGFSFSSLNIRFNWVILLGWYVVLAYFLIKRQNQ